MLPTVEHHPKQSRFDVSVEGELCVADYRLDGDVMHVFHTGVPPRLEGRGIAASLMKALLDHAQAHGIKVDPICSYARAYMQRHPETLALLA